MCTDNNSVLVSNYLLYIYCSPTTYGHMYDQSRPHTAITQMFMQSYPDISAEEPHSRSKSYLGHDCRVYFWTLQARQCMSFQTKQESTAQSVGLRLRNEAPLLPKMMPRQFGPKLPQNEVMPRHGITVMPVFSIFEALHFGSCLVLVKECTI